MPSGKHTDTQRTNRQHALPRRKGRTARQNAPYGTTKRPAMPDETGLPPTQTADCKHIIRLPTPRPAMPPTRQSPPTRQPATTAHGNSRGDTNNASAHCKPALRPLHGLKKPVKTQQAGKSRNRHRQKPLSGQNGHKNQEKAKKIAIRQKKASKNFVGSEKCATFALAIR